MNQKLWFLCFRGMHNSLPSFWANLGYSRIKIDIISILYLLQFKIGVHLLNVKLLQLLTPVQSILNIRPSCMNSLNDQCPVLLIFSSCKSGWNFRILFKILMTLFFVFLKCKILIQFIRFSIALNCIFETLLNFMHGIISLLF